MEVKQLLALMRTYDKQLEMIRADRYTVQTQIDRAYPKYFGMNPDLMMTSPDEMIQAFLDQEKRAVLLRDLLSGQEVDPEEMKRLLHISMEELEEAYDEALPLLQEIPDKLVVLTFDDSYRDQYEIALPILKELGFGATFMITELEEEQTPQGRQAPFSDKSVYMDWEQIKDLDVQGFEIGNHSLHHVRGCENMGVEFNVQQMKDMEAEFEKHGIKKPVSYAYPCGICNDTTYEAARQLGYLWCRGNMEDGICGMSGMTYYDPLVDSPLALRSFGDCDFYGKELLQMRIDGAVDGRILGLTYHSVKHTGAFPGGLSFREQMEMLKEQGCTVIAQRDLAKYIDPLKAREYTK